MYQQPTAEDFSALPLEELERRINEFNKSRDEIIENMRRNKRKLVESGEMTTEEYVKRCRLDEMPLYLNQEDMNAYSIVLWKKSGEEEEEPELLKLMEEDKSPRPRGDSLSSSSSEDELFEDDDELSMETDLAPMSPLSSPTPEPAFDFLPIFFPFAIPPNMTPFFSGMVPVTTELLTVMAQTGVPLSDGASLLSQLLVILSTIITLIVGSVGCKKASTEKPNFPSAPDGLSHLLSSMPFSKWFREIRNSLRTLLPRGRGPGDKQKVPKRGGVGGRVKSQAPQTFILSQLCSPERLSSVPISLHSTMSAVKRDFEDFHGEMYESSYFLENPRVLETVKVEFSDNFQEPIAQEIVNDIKRNRQGKNRPGEEFEEFYRNMYETSHMYGPIVKKPKVEINSKKESDVVEKKKTEGEEFEDFYRNMYETSYMFAEPAVKKSAGVELKEVKKESDASEEEEPKEDFETFYRNMYESSYMFREPAVRNPEAVEFVKRFTNRNTRHANRDKLPKVKEEEQEFEEDHDLPLDVDLPPMSPVPPTPEPTFDFTPIFFPNHTPVDIVPHFPSMVPITTQVLSYIAQAGIPLSDASPFLAQWMFDLCLVKDPSN
ncbi:unnamed protein product [Caenorhabditis auriculariae]|uniref:Uncharacterized protein n=1 Tax=Caenorhabditis auriculariae TaxID=2777116 RepID=A0A8S1HSF4_9PELO|nr:unnamed protein product [Caenorhabditis auriculariae]